MYGPHLLFPKASFEITKFSDTEYIPYVVGYTGVREHCLIGDYRFSIQAGSEFPSSYPPVNAARLSQFAEYEVAAWHTRTQLPLKVTADVNFAWMQSLHSKQYVASTGLIVYKLVNRNELQGLVHTARSIMNVARPIASTKRVALRCDKCNDPGEYAEPNLPNGGFRCWKCKTTPFYK